MTMANTIELDDQQKASISRQIGSRLDMVRGMAPGSGTTEELAETFPIWVADDQIGAAPGAAPKLLLRSSAHDTGTLHHNITIAGSSAPGGASQSVVASARSRSQGPGGGYVVEAITRPAPGDNLLRWIRNAAYWVETNAPGKPFVRLLIIPSRYTHCFWLAYPDVDRVVVIDMPDKFKHLEYRKIYDAGEFFRLLQQEPATSGLGGP
jgi:hypothetical protein